MALYQTAGHEAEARAALAHAQQIVQDKLPRLDGGDLGNGWFDTCQTYILLREATALIERDQKAAGQSKQS